MKPLVSHGIPEENSICGYQMHSKSLSNSSLASIVPEVQFVLSPKTIPTTSLTSSTPLPPRRKSVVSFEEPALPPSRRFSVPSRRFHGSKPNFASSPTSNTYESNGNNNISTDANSIPTNLPRKRSRSLLSRTRSHSPPPPFMSFSKDRKTSDNDHPTYPISPALSSVHQLPASASYYNTFSDVNSFTDASYSFSISDEKIHILFGITGTVSALKTPLIINKLLQLYGPQRISIQVIVTNSASNFMSESKVKIPSCVRVWYDEDEWNTWKNWQHASSSQASCISSPGGSCQFGPVLHVKLMKWADILVIAPLSANTLAKIANGLSDNLLTSVIRCWNPDNPILAALALNSYMYDNIMTKKHLDIIKNDLPYIELLKPVEKVIKKSEDLGMVGMREWGDIVENVVITIGGLPPVEDEDGDISEDDGGFDFDEDNDDDDDDEDEDEDEDEDDEDEDEDDEDNIFNDNDKLYKLDFGYTNILQSRGNNTQPIRSILGHFSNDLSSRFDIMAS